MVAQLSLFEAPSRVDILAGLSNGDPDGLRYYQRDAVDAFHAALTKGYKRPLIVKATGLGKTQTFGAIVKHWPGRVLVLAHREELVFQARDRIEQMTGELVGVEKAELYSSRQQRIVVGSVQTVTKDRRLERLQALGGFTLIVVDEAHHYVAKSYRRPIEFFKDAMVLGVTATPWRTDKKALGKVFDVVCFEKNILDGIEEGFLCPLEGCQVDITELDISQVKATAGDFNQAQLDESVLKGVEGIVQKTLELHGRRKGPIFFPGKASANLACARFNAMKPGCAEVVTDDTPPEERKAIMAAVKRGEVQYLCNVMVATEGFDWPEADMVGLARPTKSVTVHTQMIGRGTRVVAEVNNIPEKDQAAERIQRIQNSPKQSCVIVDFVGNCGKHSPVNVVDIFQGSYTDAEVKKAKMLAGESGGDPQDPRLLLAKARKELMAMAAAVRSKAKAKVTKFDVFAATGISAKASEEYTQKYGWEPASEKQKALLTKWGVEGVEQLSKHDARKAINTVQVRRAKNLATTNQLKVLARQGWTNRNITFESARHLIDYCRDRNWKTTPGALESLMKTRKEAQKNEQGDTGGIPRSRPGTQVFRKRPGNSQVAHEHE